eukprot:6191824-Pleurochrysis_carterae.AAC.1
MACRDHFCLYVACCLDRVYYPVHGHVSRFLVLFAAQRQPYELLDYSKGQFDRDFLEFNANIHELEASLQGFINSSFENITSTEQVLDQRALVRY